MPFTVTVQHEPVFLRLQAAGAATLGDLCGVMDLAYTAASKHGHTCVLLDLLQVEIGFSFTDHMALGSHAASALSTLERVASVVHPRFRVGTSEKAAQKMGLQLRTFTELAPAEDWLLATRMARPSPSA